MRTLDTSCPLVVGSAGVGVTPGPSQWKSGEPVTSVDKVTEQLRVTVSPAMTEEEGEEVREMMTGPVEVELVIQGLNLYVLLHTFQHTLIKIGARLSTANCPISAMYKKTKVAEAI